MKKITFFTILFFSVLFMNAQKKEIVQRGGFLNSSNVITFTPANQAISASSGVDKQATIRVNCYGGNPGFSGYNLVVISLPDNGWQGVNNVNTNMVPGDVHDRVFTFSLNVNAPTTSIYKFRADWYDEAGNFFQKNLNITVNYTPDNTDTDGDGVPDSQDDCPNVAGPVSNNGCPECNLTSPLNKSTTNIEESVATLNWNNVSGNEGYQIKYRKVPGTWIIVNTSANSTSYSLNNLQENSDYKWKIATKCNGAIGVFGSSLDFTTLDECTLNAPSGLVAFSITANNAAITWNSVNDSFGYQSQYRKVSSSSDWIDISNGNPNIGFSIVDLQPETVYRIRVRTQCENGVFGNWSQEVGFATLCSVNPPTSITISSTNPNYTDISWSSVVGSYGYNSEYSELGTNNWITLSENNLGTGFSVVGLTPTTSYVVRVRSKCASTGGNYGVWKYQSFISSARIAQVNISPNPAKDKIKIESDNPIKNWEVINSFGKKQGLKIDAKKEINISSLPLGIYSIYIELENGNRITKKFIKY